MAWWWMHAKLGLVALLVAHHSYSWWYMMKLREDSSFKTHVFFRIFNEIPVLILIGAVVLIVVKPTL